MLNLLNAAGAGKTVMTSTHMETMSLFKDVVEGLHRAGFQWEPGPARANFKREKSAFFEAIEEYDGRPPCRECPVRFRLLRKLWVQAGRPHWSKRRPGSEYFL